MIMKNWVMGLLLVSTQALGAWSNQDVLKSKEHVLSVSSGIQGRQGVLMTKVQKNAKDAYLISLVAEGKIYRRMAVPRGVFLDHYFAFREIYEKSEKSARSPAFCRRTMDVTRRNNLDPLVTRTLCLEQVSRTERKRMTQWYRGIQELFQTSSRR
jgi:hypothetical protein